MDKIKALLQKAGISEELASKICESLDKYRTTLREQFEADYLAKVEQAKKVCIDETESHKRELARRLQIFCEAKGAAIEAQLTKQAALSESEALAKLRSITEMLSGLTDGKTNGQSTAVVTKARKQIQLANEEKKKAVEIANRQTAIAEKALKENRRLATEVARLKQTSPVVKESRTQGRIDQSRGRQQRPVSTRPTILENQDPRPTPKRTDPQTVSTGAKTGYSVDTIATVMEEDLV